MKGNGFVCIAYIKRSHNVMRSLTDKFLYQIPKSYVLFRFINIKLLTIYGDDEDARSLAGYSIFVLSE